jgi:hypothetical protein
LRQNFLDLREPYLIMILDTFPGGVPGGDVPAIAESTRRVSTTHEAVGFWRWRLGLSIRKGGDQW